MSASGPIRVLVVDDNAILRMGLTALLAADPGIAVVGEAEDGDEAVLRCRELEPDVVLLDVRMPGRDGLSALPECAAISRVVMLTFTDEMDVMRDAMAAGASGYLVHGTFDADSLSHSIRTVAAGVRLLSDRVLSALVVEPRRPEPQPRRAAEHALSGRQAEVMDAIAKGMNNAQIAQALFLSEKTVKNHINQIFARLGATSRGHAIAIWLGSAAGDGLGA